MKTSIKTLFASVLTAIVLTSSAFSTIASDKVPATKSTTVSFNKVVVTGNASIVLVQGDTETLSTYEISPEGETTVKQRGYTLYINSDAKNPAVVYVYVKDLQRIDASNTATVKTKGNFDLQVLQIFLKDSAKANVNAKVGSLYTDMKDQSDLRLSGSSAEFSILKADIAKLKMNDFISAQTNTVAAVVNSGNENTAVVKSK